MLASLVGDVDLDDVVRPAGPAISPLDGDNADAADQLVEPEVVDLVRLEAVQVDMVERRFAAAVLLDQREGWTGHVLGRRAETLREPAHERGLPRPERSEQQHDVTGVEL